MPIESLELDLQSTPVLGSSFQAPRRFTDISLIDSEASAANASSSAPRTSKCRGAIKARPWSAISSLSDRSGGQSYFEDVETIAEPCGISWSYQKRARHSISVCFSTFGVCYANILAMPGLSSSGCLSIP
eukprot:Skav227266  [mRNA]  locus=scaffold3417:190840:196076:- [translate_table: standard]